MLFDRWWLSIPVALLFLGLVWVAGRSLPGNLDGDRHAPTGRRRVAHGLVALLIGSVWQVLGLLATSRFVSEELGLAEYDGISDLLDFLAASWHMTLMPIFAAIPAGTVDGYHARYYFALLGSSPALVLLLALAAVLPHRRR